LVLVIDRLVFYEYVCQPKIIRAPFQHRDHSLDMGNGSFLPQELVNKVCRLHSPRIEI
jgi:hypothetical protein